MIKKYIKPQIQDNFIGVLGGQQTGPPRSIHSVIQKLFTHPLQRARQLEREIRQDQNVSCISEKSSLENVALDQGQDCLLIFHPWG